MEKSHRTTVLVTSCLKTPVDPETKVPLAAYEREPSLEYEDSGSDSCDQERGVRDRLDLRSIFFSNEEYYAKLEELKKAHLHTMAELENMYHRKLQHHFLDPCHITTQEAESPCLSSCSATLQPLRKSHSAGELRKCSGHLDSFIKNESANNDLDKDLLLSPKSLLKNMWCDFKVRKNERTRKNQDQENWKHKMTIPKPFHMTLREAQRQKHGIRTRTEVELENAELRRQLEELKECQKKFRASPVPAHVYLPLYEELKDQKRNIKEKEHPNQTVPKPFSFLERERLKKEERECRQSQQPSDQDNVKPFKARPVPKSVYVAASGQQMEEEQLYRSIKKQMRAQELLHSASVPTSMLERRLSDRKKNKVDGESSFTHQPQINKDVPDFDASYRRFQKHLEKLKEVKPTTMCEPFDLRTSQIPSHRDRILADIEKDQQQSSPRMQRWLHLIPSITLKPCDSKNALICDQIVSLSRKVLEQRKKAEEEEERWREKQKQREKKLKRVVLKKAQANDPHQALSQTHACVMSFTLRKQECQRRREYQQEIKEIQQRVKLRPLLLEQVAQVPKALSEPSQGKMGYLPVQYRKVFLNDDDLDDPPEKDTESEDNEEEEKYGKDPEDGHRNSDDSCHYSDDHESYSDESECNDITRPQEVGD
uniref:Protein FAM161A n=1 Tax=Cynoglossus semilaevis TaxID=244447 RepID=A0A3P8X3P0_CYNSE